MIISSQRFLSEETVEEKKNQFNGASSISLPIWNAGVVDGMELFVLADGHHRFEAATQMGITVEFEVVEHEAGLTGEELLNAEWMDSDYYDIQTGKNVW
jgi:uncharacterized protein (DUF1015 family)